MHLDGRTVKPDEPFSFDLNLFDTSSPAVAYLVLTFVQLGHDGLGPGRGRADLVDVTQLAEKGQARRGFMIAVRLAYKRQSFR